MGAAVRGIGHVAAHPAGIATRQREHVVHTGSAVFALPPPGGLLSLG